MANYIGKLHIWLHTRLLEKLEKYVHIIPHVSQPSLPTILALRLSQTRSLDVNRPLMNECHLAYTLFFTALKGGNFIWGRFYLQLLSRSHRDICQICRKAISIMTLKRLCLPQEWCPTLELFVQECHQIKSAAFSRVTQVTHLCSEHKHKHLLQTKAPISGWKHQHKTETFMYVFLLKLVIGNVIICLKLEYKHHLPRLCDRWLRHHGGSFCRLSDYPSCGHASFSESHLAIL